MKRTQEPVISELFVLQDPNLRWLSELHEHYPHSRSIYWHPGIDGRRSLERAMSMAERVIVQDHLVAPLAQESKIGVTGLSEFDPALARRVGTGLADDALRADSNGVFPVPNGPVLFCPSNDTHTKLFEPIARRLSSAAFLLHDERPEERAREMLETIGLPYREGGAQRLAEIRPSVIVVGNDWYEGAWRLFERAYALKIPTVCIQEGCLDFSTHRRMQWCDYPFVQGPIMLGHFRSPLYFLSGNPRFDSLSPLDLPGKPVSMLNCNFTYGVEEGAREEWVGAVSRACRELGIDYFISQHPRDRGEFPNHPVRPSHAGVVHEHLADSSILVTRFSTLVYEALLTGRQVVYYNPHRETMRLFSEDETGGIYKADDQESLAEALAAASEPLTAVGKARRERFLELHCGENDGRAAHRCAASFAALAELASPRTGSAVVDWFGMWSHRRRTRLTREFRDRKNKVRRTLSPLKRRLLGNSRSRTGSRH
ncbi:hypothetical protein N9166_01165 [bacterium]|nr:hypothetical protein [bacterium]